MHVGISIDIALKRVIYQKSKKISTYFRTNKTYILKIYFFSRENQLYIAQNQILVKFVMTME